MVHNKPSPEIEKIGYAICSFYTAKYNHDYVEANKAMAMLQIRDIKKDSDVIEIYLGRPDLIIGRLGENIDALEKWLKCKIKIIETFCWEHILCAYDPEMYIY